MFALKGVHCSLAAVSEVPSFLLSLCGFAFAAFAAGLLPTMAFLKVVGKLPSLLFLDSCIAFYMAALLFAVYHIISLWAAVVFFFSKR